MSNGNRAYGRNYLDDKSEVRDLYVIKSSYLLQPAMKNITRGMKKRCSEIFVYIDSLYLGDKHVPGFDSTVWLGTGAE